MCAYTMILDNDTTVPEGDIGWLDRFIAELEEHPDTACVGAVTNYANPPQHALTVPITYQSPWKDEQDGKVTREGIAENPPVPSFVSFAVLFRTAALQQIGQWDERYNPGNFEDTDYSVRVREAGMSIRVARSVYLHHEGHATFSEDLQRLLKVNGQKFFDKWGIGRLYDLGFVSPRQLAGALRASHAAN
jgi:GT2 family glycosyltransferase